MASSHTRGALWLVAMTMAFVTATAASRQKSSPVIAVDDTALGHAPEHGDTWLSYGRDDAETRYSPLDQINAANVAGLKPVWSYDLHAVDGAQEATPLVWNGTIYGITNWSIVFAVDARTGHERWRYDPGVDEAKISAELCCGAVNRGLALYKNMIVAPVIDGRLQALDAATGAVIWTARVTEPGDQHTLTMAPRIVRGRVIIGASGGDFPTRGFFDAYDAATGQRAWRVYTVPGDPAKPFENAAMKAAADTWGGDSWKLGGGGAVWDGLAYDPIANLIYVGTGNAEPWAVDLRGPRDKDNLYTCSILAVRADTGAIVWHYQLVPGDVWDFDSTQQLVLADLTIDGRPRKVVMQAAKDGFFYVIDRLTGAFISAQPFARVNWAKGIDPSTGRPIANPDAYYGQASVSISPGGGGAHNWAPMSFNLGTGLVYVPAATGTSLTFAAQSTLERSPGGIFGATVPAPTPTGAPLPTIGPDPIGSERRSGALIAWDPVAQQTRWRQPGGGPIGGGTVTTAGTLVFQTLNDGRLVAYRADTGEKLLELATGVVGGIGPPITYAIDGVQYVALMGGIGVSPGNGPAPAGSDSANATRLMTFALGADQTTPAVTIAQ